MAAKTIVRNYNSLCVHFHFCQVHIHCLYGEISCEQWFLPPNKSCNWPTDKLIRSIIGPCQRPLRQLKFVLRRISSQILHIILCSQQPYFLWFPFDVCQFCSINQIFTFPTTPPQADTEYGGHQPTIDCAITRLTHMPSQMWWKWKIFLLLF